ncbi:MAG: T9SS C-terminal target domain-containing protein, partial [Chitinophagia bacterium]|nr:T9SS C-terminal target domain-containing protein [Chitinophagia bacterium]
QRSITTEFAGPWADVYGDFQFAAPQLRKSLQSAGVIGLYPNPTTGEVQFTDVVERVTVVDIHGRVVMEENDSAIKGLSLAMLPKGIYIVELTRNGVLSQHKVVLKD